MYCLSPNHSNLSYNSYTQRSLCWCSNYKHSTKTSSWKNTELCFSFKNDLLLMRLCETKIKGNIKKENYWFFSTTMQEISCHTSSEEVSCKTCVLMLPKAPYHCFTLILVQHQLNPWDWSALSTLWEAQSALGVKLPLSLPATGSVERLQLYTFWKAAYLQSGQFYQRGIEISLSGGHFIPLLSVFLFFNF